MTIQVVAITNSPVESSVKKIKINQEKLTLNQANKKVFIKSKMQKYVIVKQLRLILR